VGEKSVRKIIRNLVGRSGFWPPMWDFMWESHPKLTKIRVFHPKSAKSKLKQIKNLGHYRRLGNSGVLTENPRVPSSSLGLGTKK